MAFAELSSKTRVYVGNGDYIVPLADVGPSGGTDPRYVLSLDIA